MKHPRVNYDVLAATYNHRFQNGLPRGTADALVDLARNVRASKVLEVGCGTGYWLQELASLVPGLYGVDLSSGMLAQARQRESSLQLIQGEAGEMPLRGHTFDLVYCVNAIHHFDNPERFVVEAFRLLRPGGTVAIVGMDPYGRRESWYVYDYFDGTYERDVQRFPPRAEVQRWLQQSGFQNISQREVEHIVANKQGATVLDDPFLQQHATSQLALLRAEEYVAGLERIRTHLEQADKTGETVLFKSEFSLEMTSGYKPPAGTP